MSMVDQLRGSGGCRAAVSSVDGWRCVGETPASTTRRGRLINIVDELGVKYLVDVIRRHCVVGQTID